MKSGKCKYEGFTQSILINVAIKALFDEAWLVFI